LGIARAFTESVAGRAEQVAQQTAAAILVLRDITALSATAAAELHVRRRALGIPFSAGSWWRRDGRPVAQWTRTNEAIK
jgi:hypothetical protein